MSAINETVWATVAIGWYSSRRNSSRYYITIENETRDFSFDTRTSFSNLEVKVKVLSQLCGSPIKICDDAGIKALRDYRDGIYENGVTADSLNEEIWREYFQASTSLCKCAPEFFTLHHRPLMYSVVKAVMFPAWLTSKFFSKMAGDFQKEDVAYYLGRLLTIVRNMRLDKFIALLPAFQKNMNESQPHLASTLDTYRKLGLDAESTIYERDLLSPIT
jgi:hypothetical protein